MSSVQYNRIPKKFRIFDLCLKKYLKCVHNLDYCLDEEQYIIEQFIGVLDKNGKELYEGDYILFVDRDSSIRTQIGKIFYDLTKFKVAFLCSALGCEGDVPDLFEIIDKDKANHFLVEEHKKLKSLENIKS